MRFFAVAQNDKFAQNVGANCVRQRNLLKIGGTLKSASPTDCAPIYPVLCEILHFAQNDKFYTNPLRASKAPSVTPPCFSENDTNQKAGTNQKTACRRSENPRRGFSPVKHSAGMFYTSPALPCAKVFRRLRTARRELCLRHPCRLLKKAGENFIFSQTHCVQGRAPSKKTSCFIKASTK